MGHLQIATLSYVESLVNKRPGETKLGEKIQLADEQDWRQSLETSNAHYVLLGIPEDIGVRANLGVGGAHTIWEPALKAILNIQHTEPLNGENIFLLGAFDFSGWMRASEKMDAEKLRAVVSNIDDLVYPVIQAIVESGKIPVVIGGGHNNAYPLLKGTSMALKHSIHCTNLDAHSDYRIMEGRHSGNGFRYAKNDGYLERYAMICLHENYNSASVISDIQKNEELHFSFYEDVFLREKFNYERALAAAFFHVTGKPAGIELDLDCIERTLSSAATPAGITPLQARQYIYQSKMQAKPAYLHLTEGATELRDGRTDGSTAKLVAYLATDFMKG
ncbi:formimidoylglutamase [Chitinophagaceae bacterium MMS25-I14]